MVTSRSRTGAGLQHVPSQRGGAEARPAEGQGAPSVQTAKRGPGGKPRGWLAPVEPSLVRALRWDLSSERTALLLL